MLPFSRSNRSQVEPAPSRETHASRAFPGLLAALPPRDAAAVLDLGKAWGGNLAFWSPRSRRFVVGDLWEALAAGPRPDPARAAAACAEALGFLDGRAPSLVLAWDLFDHLHRDELAALGSALAAGAGPGTRLFAIVTVRGEVADAPRLHRVAGPEVLELEPAVARRAPAVLKEPDLCRLLTGFRVESTHLLRSGVQEYVFVYDPPGAAAALATMRAAGGAPTPHAAVPQAAAPHAPRPVARAVPFPRPPVVRPPVGARVGSPAVASEPRPAAVAPAPPARTPVASPSAEPDRIRPSFTPHRRLELPWPKNPKLPSR